MKSPHTVKPGSILVIGAGELGMPVLRNLARKAEDHDGTTVSVLLRAVSVDSNDPVKMRDLSEIRDLGIEIVTGDILAASVSELAQMFAPFETVIGCAGFSAGSDAPMKLAKAALEAKLTRYFPWQFGVDFDVIGRGSPQDLFDAQIDVRDLLRGQTTTDWVVISTGMFTSFLFEPIFGVVDFEKDRVNALGSLDTEVTLTTPDDIGALTAEIVFAQPMIRNEIVYLAGDTVTYGEVAETLQAVLGRPFAKSDWTVPQLKADLAQDPDNHIKKYRAVFAEGRGVAWPKEDSFNARNGLSVMTAEDWMRKHLRSSWQMRLGEVQSRAAPCQWVSGKSPSDSLPVGCWVTPREGPRKVRSMGGQDRLCCFVYSNRHRCAAGPNEVIRHRCNNRRCVNPWPSDDRLSV